MRCQRLLLSMLFLCSGFLLRAGDSAASREKNGVLIHGQFVNKSEKGVLEVRLYREYFSSISQWNYQEFISKEGKYFDIQLDSIDHPVYIALSFPDAPGRYSKTLFLVEPGDSIWIQISDNSLQFSGKGADKIKFQMQQISYDSIVVRQRYNSFYDYLSLLKKQEDSICRINSILLESYRSTISPVAFRILSYDILGDKNEKILSDLRFYWKNAEGSLTGSRQKDIIAFCKRQLPALANPPGLIDELIWSRSYSGALLDKVQLEHELRMSRRDDDYFTSVYADIQSRYKGKLREKLLVDCLHSLFLNHPQANSYVYTTLKFIRYKPYYSLVARLQKNLPGQYAYPFSLEDSSGKAVLLKDFRGRVVVVDYWFTGCAGCLQLAKALAPFMDSLSHEKDLAFVSVNIDRDRDLWKKSLQSGRYTHAGTINLYTGGKGENHPVVTYYGYRAFPKLLIIDKDGTILLSNPPQPFDSRSATEFMALIRKLKDGK